ncbi:MAG: NAD(P)/FAD-dependent oxidoreductase [Pseudomonadota bacterium]
MRLCIGLTLFLVLQACRHPLVIVGQGDIVDLNGGGFGCTLEQFESGDAACDNEVQGDYFVNYTAVPREGWRFERWDGICSNESVDDNCRIDVSFDAVLAWNEQSNGTPAPPLTAIFEPLPMVMNTAHDVVVVGAGSAGLYATRTLQALGYDVLLIEATDRVGGRVKSATLGDMRVELGAEEHYLARGGNPVWPAILNRYGESIYTRSYQGIDVYSMDNGTGTCWTKADAAQPCSADADVTAVDEFWNWYWREDLHQDADASLADNVLRDFGVGPGDRAYHIYDSSIAGGSFATNLNRLGARSLARQSSAWGLSDGIRVLADKDLGYSDALNTLWWNDVVATGEVLLNTPVTRIDTSGSDVVVTDANGSQHAARQVIVTVSIGVLQDELIDFIPDLPSNVVAAYNGIGIDDGMKVPMRFNAAWWETEGEPMGWMVTEGVAGACWAPSDYKQNSSSHILMCYPMGENGRTLTAIAEAAGGGEAGDAAIIAAVLDDLDGTLPQAPRQASETYIEGLVQDWGAAPYTRGVYSYAAPGSFETVNDNLRRDLRTPVAGNRVFFAGEATSVRNSATVVGALQEGERAANDVHAINGNPGNSPPPIR